MAKKAKLSSLDKPLIEKSEIRSISLKDSEAEEIKTFGEGLTSGIKACHQAAKLVKELGDGDIEKGKRKLIAALDKMAAKKEVN